MRRIVGAVVGVVLGCLLIVVAATSLPDDDVVTCGGSEMNPGDLCAITNSRGKVTRNTYGEMESSRSTDGLVGIGLGSIIVLVAAVKLGGAVRDHRRATAAARDVPPVPGQPRPVKGTWGPRQPVAKPPRQPPPD